MKTDAADDETFFALTPEMVLEAAEEAGLRPSGHTWTLNSLENRVYDLRLEDGNHVVTKFYRPGRWKREQLEEEHRFVFELRDADVPVCAPMPFPDGRTLHERSGILFAVWPRTGGRAPDELSPQQAEVLGRLTARLHNVGASRSAPGRPSLTADSYVREPLEFLLQSNQLPRPLRARYQAAAKRLAAIYEDLSGGVPTIRIHGDCHLGNILFGEQGWSLLDFDDFAMGPAVQDVWMLFPREGPEVGAVRAAFLEGYRSFREFPEHWWKLAEVLRGMRYIHYSAWVARRFGDPAFPAAYPHFGTESYWEQETMDLEDQLLLIESESPQLANAAGPAAASQEAELTNKDFFWDWEDP